MKNNELIQLTLFCLHHQVDRSLILSLSEIGLIEIVVINHEHYLSNQEMTRIERLIRLHNELGINLEGIDVIDGLLNQIKSLQEELIRAKNRAETFAPNE